MEFDVRKINEYSDDELSRARSRVVDLIVQDFPYGYLKYFRGIAKACHQQGVLRGEYGVNSILKVAPEPWLEYFNKNISPRLAVYLDLKEGGIQGEAD